MTASAPGTTASRPAVVDQQLARATAALCRDHPAHATTVRGVLAPLRDRLRRLHQDCQAADAAAWSAYTADLDRGLAELEIEVARAAERTGGVEQVLGTAATQFERRAEELREETGQV
ncbi:hypothetical protein [Modestobacter versicolor]|uniref:hypothetical protein n=1 Tax=Modestobacter versicolor TaxID=429133 RepID=UPI0034DF1CB1